MLKNYNTLFSQTVEPTNCVNKIRGLGKNSFFYYMVVYRMFMYNSQESK